MANVVSAAPSTIETQSFGSTLTWTNPNNALTENGSSATCTASSSDFLTQMLEAYGFGFDLPADAIAVTGIRAECKCMASSGSYAATLQWSKDHNSYFNDLYYGQGSSISTSALTWTIGNGQEGEPSSGKPSIAEVESASFGMGVYFFTGGGVTPTFTVDAFRMTVWYSLPVTDTGFFPFFRKKWNKIRKWFGLVEILPIHSQTREVSV